MFVVVGPVKVAIGMTTSARDQLISTGDGAVTITGDGTAGVTPVACWACTSNVDGWSVYGVEHEDRIVVLRVRLTDDSDHAFLIDRRSAGLPIDVTVASNARTYSRHHRYSVGDELQHPTFGPGKVITAKEKTVEVAFAIGVKILAHAPSA